MTGEKSHFSSTELHGYIIEGFITARVSFGNIMKLNHQQDSGVCIGEQCLDEFVTIKGSKVFSRLTDSDITNRQIQLLGDAEYHTAFGGTIELG